MARNLLAQTIHLKSFLLMTMVLFAISGVQAHEGDNDETQGAGKIASRGAKVTYNSNSICYNNQKQQVACTKKKAIIVASVISTLFAIMGILYLYVTCSERRKKRKERSISEENQPLSSEVGCIPDCEKGIAKAGKKGRNHDYFTPSDKSDEESTYGAGSTTVSEPPDYDNLRGSTQTYTPLNASDSGHRPLAMP